MEKQRFCTSCGKMLPEGARVCPYCGNPIENINNNVENLHDIPHEKPYSLQNRKTILKWIIAISVCVIIISILVFQFVYRGGSPVTTSNSGSPQEKGGISATSGDSLERTVSISGTQTTDSEEDSKQTSSVEDASSEQESTVTMQKVTHRFEAYVEDVSWEEAFDNARNKGGRLATIRSESDWSNITEALDSVGKTNVNYYISGARGNKSPYRWIDENMNFIDGNLTTDSTLSKHWYEEEPSYEDAVEDPDGNTIHIEESCLMLMMPSDQSAWYLNDASTDIINAYPSNYDFHGRVGYVVEYDE